MGIPIIINVFDTENNLDTVKKIISDERVKSSNILLDLIFSKNFNLTRNFFRNDSNKILINPLSKNYNFLKDTSNIYFFNSIFKDTERFIIKLFDNKREG